MQKLSIFWYKVKARIISRIVNWFASQTNDDVANTVLLLGSARSGTTFLMESINTQNDFRIIFEPFNPTYTKEWKQFSARHYINPSSVNDEEKGAVEKIVKGRINNSWVDQYNRKLRSEKRLIKAVRANLMLDYFEKEHQEMQVIYAYRNPHDVVASRMSLQFDPKDVFLVLNHGEFLNKYYADIDIPSLKAKLNTPEKCHVALWCLENRFILESLEHRDLIVANYDELKGKTVTLHDDKLQISNKERRPSVTSSIHQPYELSEMEKNNVTEILTIFGMENFVFKS